MPAADNKQDANETMTDASNARDGQVEEAPAFTFEQGSLGFNNGKKKAGEGSQHSSEMEKAQMLKEMKEQEQAELSNQQRLRDEARDKIAADSSKNSLRRYSKVKLRGCRRSSRANLRGCRKDRLRRRRQNSRA
jgi:hypothetical protein